jgi:hypothetical protein
VLAGPVLWPLDDAPTILGAYRDIIAVAPREVATIVTLRRVRRCRPSYTHDRCA